MLRERSRGTRPIVINTPPVYGDIATVRPDRTGQVCPSPLGGVSCAVWLPTDAKHPEGRRLKDEKNHQKRMIT